MAQQTAVEWFWIHLPEKISKEYFDLFEQAKAIEKKQIINACNALSDYPFTEDDSIEYYNETYKK